MPAFPFAFVEAEPCRAALDRADHLRHDASALARLWPDARVVLLDDTGLALADEHRRLLAPTGAQLSDGPGGPGAAAFLGVRLTRFLPVDLALAMRSDQSKSRES